MNRVTALLLLLALPLTVQAKDDLMSVYEAARQNDPDLLSAEAAAGAAGARDKAARGQILPQIGASAKYREVKQVQDFEDDNALPPGFASNQSDEEEEFETNEEFGINLRQPLFNWAAFQAKKATATRKEQSLSELDFKRSELIARVSQRYFEVLSAQADVEAARQREKAVSVQMERSRAAFESGLSPITDLQQAESQLDAVKVDAIAAENQRANNLDLLSQLTGKQHQALATASPPFPVETPESGSAADWVQKALANNPALTARKLAADAARFDIRTQRGKHYPTLDFVASYGEAEQPVDFGFGNTQLITESTAYGVELTVPIFAGFTTSAQVEEATFLHEQTRLDIVRTRRQIETETRTAFRNVQASAARVNALRQAIRSGETSVKAAKAGLETGTRNILDVLDAELALIQRQGELKQAWYQYVSAGVLLKHLAGELKTADLQQVNAALQ